MMRVRRGNARCNHGMRIACVLACWLLLAGAWLASPARAESPALAEYAHDSWTTRQGLPHNSVLDIAQSKVADFE